MIAIASLVCFACSPGPDDSTTETGTTISSSGGETSDSGTTETGGTADCIPPLETQIAIQLRHCSSEPCDEIDLDAWEPNSELGTLTATCSIASAPIALNPSKQRWLLEDCTGDEIPDDGRLALDWETDPVIEPSLPMNTSLSVEFRRIRVDAHLLSIRDPMGELLVLESANHEPPPADFSTPVTIAIGATLCELPPESCSGERLIHDLLIGDGGGNELQLGWGDFATLGDDPGYSVLMRRAQSYPWFPCGQFSSGGNFDIVVAR